VTFLYNRELLKAALPINFFLIFAVACYIADRIFNSWISGLLLELGLVLSAKRQSLPLAGVAIGEFNRGVDQSSGLGAIKGWSLGVLT
jgi:hypothetical protein